MEPRYHDLIAADVKIDPGQVQATLDLMTAGATVPFIARYRKEVTGGLDEVVISKIRDLAARLEDLAKRRAAILKSLKKNGHLDDALEDRIMAADSLSRLEDIYLPYRPKRRTRAMVARRRGLEPLALTILKQDGIEPQQAAADYITPENEIDSTDAALGGARDIIAEIINEDEGTRAALRDLFRKRAELRSSVVSGKEEQGSKYRDYFEWSEPAATAPSHRILAIRRGEKEDILNMSILPSEPDAMECIDRRFVKGDGQDSIQVSQAALDAYKRLLARAMETEIRLATKERADADAIQVFSENLRQLLLAPPLGAKRVMGVDPGFRTGCKLACLDRQGQLLHHETIQPHTSERSARQAVTVVEKLCQRFNIEAIAIGNGTASRETEAFFRSIEVQPRPQVVIVNESGASVYSASPAARQEFPNLDLTFRGAVSIGRRLMDPLAELVKIDPKSIGVGQYQHDVDQTALKQALDDVVISCVNHVGVDVNRASAQLLTYVSGLGPQLADNILTFRNANGPFRNRKALMKVPRLGPKAFEQAAGFLKIQDGTDPLDASLVHPESYPIVQTMASDLDCSIQKLLKSPELKSKIDIHRYVNDKIGIPTLSDILAELDKPGRDPRKTFKFFAFAKDVKEMADLEPGMKLPGIVTNVTAFGAFVDVGVHQDGLVHISQLADRFVSDPHTVAKVNQEVTVTVLAIDHARKRIALSMKENAGKKTGAGLKKTPFNKKSVHQPTQPKTAEPTSRRPFNNAFANAFKRSK